MGTNRRIAGRLRPPVGYILAAMMWLGVAGSQAQTPAAGTKGAGESTAEVAEKLSDEELDALTARIALYPDPLLAVVLQAATLPLQIVEAERFLAKRVLDSKAQPNKRWDASITALLNYPSVVAMMADDLDWVQALGQAVLNQLPDVQDSIQQFRAQVQAAGLLKSDDKQTVTVDGGVIKIEPAQPQVIYVPMYDGAALAAAIAAERPGSVDAVEIAPAQPALPAEQAVAPAPAPIEPATSAAPAAAATPASAPAYPPAYAYPPPTYSDPYPSFWTPAASFVGGAVVGGLLGYALGRDDDDDIEVYHHGDGYGGGRNVSGNRVVAGNTINVDRTSNRREDNNQAQAALRARSGGQGDANSARGREARAQLNRGGVAPVSSGTGTRPQAQRTPERTAAMAGRGSSQTLGAGGSPRAGRVSAGPGNQASGRAFGDLSSGRDVRREAARGAQSRAAGTQRSFASAAPGQRQVAAQRVQQRPQREATSARRSASNGGAFANSGGGQRAAQSASRGAQSRGGGAAARAGGGGGGGRRR